MDLKSHPFIRVNSAVVLTCTLCWAASASTPLFDLHAKVGGVQVAEASETGGIRPVPLTENGVHVLRQPCRFASGIARAGWDYPVRLDLRRGRGIQFSVRCPNVLPVSYFACYFKSGAGWYRAEFAIRGTGNWETVDILKSETGIEGKPSGWHHIEKIRVSAWSNARRNTSFDIAAPYLLDAPMSVVIVRGSSVVTGGAAGEIGLVTRQAKLTATLLEANGVPATFMEDFDLAGGVPEGTRTVILPYNPVPSGNIDRAILRFYSAGGGIVGFYEITAGLQQATGIRKKAYIKAGDVNGGLEGIALVGTGLPGAPLRISQTSWNANVLTPAHAAVTRVAYWTNSQGELTPYPAILASPRAVWMSHILRNEDPKAGGRLLMAMVGHTWPGVWRSSLSRQIADLGRDIHPSGFDSALSWLDSVVGKRGLPKADKQIALARHHRQQALTLHGNGNYLLAAQSLQAAKRAMQEAFFLIQPRADEFRGAWCHRGYGVAGWSWAHSARQLRATGFSAVFPNIANASEGWYATTLLDPPAGVPGNRDYLAECLRASRQFGLQCHPWMVCFKLDDNISAVRLAELRGSGLLMMSASGKQNEHWLCPTNPVNRGKMLGVAAEILSRYAVDGLHLDYIRLPGTGYCYCPQCRRAFEKAAGGRIVGWPQSVQSNGPFSRKWEQFRVDQVTAFVRDVAALRDRLRPGAKVSAAVYADAATAKRSVAQDWPAWAARGYIDFVCPMDYTADEAHLTQMVTRQLGLARGRIPVYPGLGLSSDGLDGVQMVKQIGVCRRAGTGGFMVFEFDREEALGPLADLAKGLTKP